MEFTHITRSDWLTDPSQPEKFTFSQLLNARDGANGTDGPTMHFSPHAKLMRSVDGGMQWACEVTYPQWAYQEMLSVQNKSFSPLSPAIYTL